MNPKEVVRNMLIAALNGINDEVIETPVVFEEDITQEEWDTNTVTLHMDDNLVYVISVSVRVPTDKEEEDRKKKAAA